MRLMDDITEGRALFIKQDGERTSKLLKHPMNYTLYECNILTEPYVGEKVYFTVPEFVSAYNFLLRVVVADVHIKISDDNRGHEYNSIRPRRLKDLIL